MSFAAIQLVAAAICAAAATTSSGGGGVPPSVRAAHEEPINVTGQETIYDSKTDTFIVKGDAVMTQGGSVLKADEIDVMRRQREARAVGNVHLIDPEVEVWATEAKINITNETLELMNAKVMAKQNTYHLEGKKIVKLQGQNYQIKEGFFTTCGCSKGAPDWSITADQMDVNIGGSGTAKGAKFNVLGQPIMKLPYAVFPADASRHSGFLSGREGQSGLRGFQWLQPYYLAINKSSDATVALDIETSQRIGGLAEYRLTNGPDDYLWVDGAFYDESIRSQANRRDDIIDNQIADPHIPLDRYGIIGMTRQHLTDNLMVYGDTISTSDSLYLREMDVWTLSRGFGSNFGSMRNAVSHFGLLDEFEDAYMRVQGTWNQDLIQPQNFALQRLPDMTLSGRQELFNNLAFADYDAQAVDFFRYKGIDGWRFDANPRITVPWRIGDYVYGYGTVGAQGTFYSTAGHDIAITPVGTNGLTYNSGVSLATGLGSNSQEGSKVTAIPYVMTGISTILDRVYDFNWRSVEKLKNTIEPFVNYAYVPRIYQGNLPLFDELDRINARSLITYGLTTRLYAKIHDSGPPPDAVTDQTPSEGLSMGQSTVGPYGETSEPGESLAPKGGAIDRGGSRSQELAQLTIQQAYDLSHQVALDGSQISDLEAIMNLYPTSIASLNSQIDYNPRSHAGITFANAYINFQPPWNSQKTSGLYMGKALQGSFVQFGYSYSNARTAVFRGTTGNGAQFMTARAYADIFDRLGLYFAPSYDLAAQQLLSSEYGVRLKSPCDCWAADVGIIDQNNPNEVQVQFQLTLGGLGSIGRSPFGRNPFQTMGLVGSPTGVLPRY